MTATIAMTQSPTPIPMIHKRYYSAVSGLVSAGLMLPRTEERSAPPNCRYFGCQAPARSVRSSGVRDGGAGDAGCEGRGCAGV
jgi:hypothetical protein